MATPKNQSVLKAFTMLKSFRHPDEWVTSSELSRRAGLPEASGYRLIQTLEEIGAMLGVTRERIRQLRDRALKHLHDGRSGRRLATYVE